MKRPSKVYIEFEDGSVETHDVSDGGCYTTTNNYRENTRIQGRIEEVFVSHKLTWNEGRVNREEQQTKAQTTANQT